MFRRSRPLLCSTATGSSFGAQHPTGRTAWVGQTIVKDVLTVDGLSTIMLLMALEAMYPGMRLIHVFLDNARCHHAKLVQAWLARPECRIKLHFIPAYCPHISIRSNGCGG